MSEKITISFESKEDLTNFIHMHIPIVIKPTRKAKTMFIDPYTSLNAKYVIIESLAESFYKKSKEKQNDKI